MSEKLKPCPLCSSALISYETHRGGETFHRHPQTSTCPLAGVRIAPEAITAWNTRPLSMTGERMAEERLPRPRDHDWVADLVEEFGKARNG